MKKITGLFGWILAGALLSGCLKEKKDGTAPDSIAGKTLHVSVSSGTPPFANSGSYSFSPSGPEGSSSGTYALTGSGGVQSNIGTYTYTKNSENTATLIETEQSQTVVHNVLTFQTGNSGTISSDIVSGGNPSGGVQSGSFTLN